MEIQLKGVNKVFSSQGRVVQALNNINLTIPANKIFTLLGPSGCGKTTLLRCIVGLEAPDSGEIIIGGETVWSKDAGISVPPQRRRLGMVFQTYAIWPHMSVFDNIAYPLQVQKVDRGIIREKVEKALAFVQLAGAAAHSVTKLSGGQQQRVALARALVAEPKVILFDEPLSNLDAKLREETRKLLKTFLSKLHITAIYVTHDRVEALALSDIVAVMHNGTLMEVGTPQDIYFNARHHFVADFIGRANLISTTVRQHDENLTLVDSDIGMIRCERRDLPIGSAATLCIRPESVQIAPAASHSDTAQTNALDGHIESLTFVGEVYEAEIRVGEKIILARVDPGVVLKEGDAIRINIKPSDCSLVSA